MTIEKIDYTTTPHPSGVVALSLKDAPALIESLLPVQKISVDSYKEQMAVHGKTLTALGSYWKGRKPLVLNRACVLSALLPATADPIKDLEVFELLMGMDNISMSKRLGLPKPEEIVRSVSIEDIHAYFVVEPPSALIPNCAPFEINDFSVLHAGKQVTPKLKWRSDISETQQHEVASLTFEFEAYRELAAGAKRAEELGATLSAHIWSKVNAHLGTQAHSLPELVEQLGDAFWTPSNPSRYLLWLWPDTFRCCTNGLRRSRIRPEPRGMHADVGSIQYRRCQFGKAS